MDGIDAATWQAVGLTLSVVGLLVSVLLWRRRGPATGLRAVAWSLLPAAAGLTGTLRLVWQIGDEIVSWAVRLVFSPVVWLGIVLAGVAVVLFGVSGAMKARARGDSPAASGKSSGRSSGRSPGKKGLPEQRSTPPAGGGRGKKGTPAVQDDDMDDIEAILRKHGIQ